MLNFHIQRKPKLEAAQINALRLAVNWQPSTFDYSAALEHSFLYYALFERSETSDLTLFENQKLIGFLNVISDGISYALIVDVMVHPKFQGLGMGKELLQTAIQDLKTADIPRVCVLYDTALKDFYAKLGFENLEGGLLKLEP